MKQIKYTTFPFWVSISPLQLSRETRSGTTKEEFYIRRYPLLRLLKPISLGSPFKCTVFLLKTRTIDFVHYFHRGCTKNRSLIEQSVAPVPPLQCLSINLTREAKTLPILTNLKGMWIKVVRMLKFDPLLNVCSSIWLNPKLHVNKSPIWWKDWIERGTVTLDDLY